MAAFIGPLLMGLSGLSGLFGNKKQQTQQNSSSTMNQTGTQAGSFSNTTTPNLDSNTLAFRDQLIGKYSNLLSQDPDLSGYSAGGLKDINAGYDIKSKALGNILASRGLSYSPAAATIQSGLESQRVGEGINFRQQIPLLAQQMYQSKLNDAGGFFSQIPYGSTQEGSSQGTSSSTSTGTNTGTQTNPGNPFAGLFGGLGSSLAYLYGNGAFGKKG